MDTTRSAIGTESWGSCEESSTDAPSVHRLGDEPAEERARGGVEAGVRLVEQPEGGATGDQRGQRDAAALPGREPAGRGRAQAAGQAEALERAVGAAEDGRPRARTAKRTFSAALSSS